MDPHHARLSDPDWLALLLRIAESNGAVDSVCRLK
jgi:hypothetical protein